MSAQPPTATQVKPSIRNDIAHWAASPVRRQLIETAAHDLHLAANFHARIRLGRAADWYIPPIAILRVLRGFVVVA